MSTCPADGNSKPRVLVVDDEPIARMSIVMRFSSIGATVVEAEDGASALKELLQQPFDAAMIDLEMPGLDGFELIGCIRGHPNLKHLAVIVLSGRDDPTSIRNALQAGATSYLLKPLNWTAFGEHIRSCIGLREHQRRASLADRAVAR